MVKSGYVSIKLDRVIWYLTLTLVFPLFTKGVDHVEKKETKYDRDKNFVFCFEILGSDRPILDAIPFFFILNL